MAQGVVGEFAFVLNHDDDDVVRNAIGSRLDEAGFDLQENGVWQCTCDTAAPLLAALSDTVEALCAPKQFTGAAPDASIKQLFCTLQRGVGKDAARKPHALIVDDNDDFRRILREHLVDAGYSVAGLAEASTLLSIAGGIHDKNKQPDVIVLDVMMPGLSGAAALDMLSRDRDASMIPVVLVSNAEQNRVAPLAKGHHRATFVPKGSFAPIAERVLHPMPENGSPHYTAHIVGSALFDTETDGLDALFRKNGFVVGASGVFENRDSELGPVKRCALAAFQSAMRFDAERGGIHRLWFAMH